MKTQTNYEAQAASFLVRSRIDYKTAFLEHGKHFDDDKQNRDIFKVTFIKADNGPIKKMSLKFGQSINDSTGNGDNPPSAYDVITCLTKNDPGTFKDFCAEFGYDTDSRKAERTYRAVVKEWEKVSAFFTVQEIEQMQEIN